MYILQLFDNHSATYSALIIGCAEVDYLYFQIFVRIKRIISKGDSDGLGLLC